MCFTFSREEISACVKPASIDDVADSVRGFGSQALAVVADMVEEYRLRAGDDAGCGTERQDDE